MKELPGAYTPGVLALDGEFLRWKISSCSFSNWMYNKIRVGVGFVITIDFLVVALLINRSLEMFASLLGTWIPFALIFTSTYLTGLLTVASPRQEAAYEPND